MCGFAAMLALDGRGANVRAIQSMTSALFHRGPDDEGLYVEGALGMGFRRLSIIDVSAGGHQPMVSDDGSLVLVFNGEIFNYVELRQELRSLGHAFRSQSDTEVLLHAFQQWGPECLSRLNGMWAFLVYDRPRRLLFGARDRFGVKPLYWYRSPEYTLLASEPKGIVASGLYNPAVNWSAARQFLLRTHLDEDESTFHSAIEQVPAGSAFELRLDGDLKCWKFWSLGAARARVADPPRAFFDTFEDSVRLRLRSDVPVGISLSGGLDSSSIATVAGRLRAEAGASSPLHAFSYTAPEFDESTYVADTAAATGAQINELAVQPRRLWDVLPTALWYWDGPVHSTSALIGFELMRLAASRGVKVVLNGQGADETLGGYHTYFGNYWETLLSEGRVAECRQEITAFALAHGRSPMRLFTKALRHTVMARLRRAARAAAITRAGRSIRHSWFNADLAQTADSAPMTVDHGLHDALRFSIERRRLPVFMRVEDRNGMAHSVESRHPFLDFRLVNLAFSLDPNWKMRGPWSKYILREAMRGHLSERIRGRLEKVGFPTSARRWFSEEWYVPMRDLLASQATRERGIYRLDVILHDLEQHRRGRIDISEKLFRVAQFELWSRAQRSARLEHASDQFVRDAGVGAYFLSAMPPVSDP